MLRSRGNTFEEILTFLFEKVFDLRDNWEKHRERLDVNFGDVIHYIEEAAKKANIDLGDR